ncbi:Paraneoplastic antigen-like protein 5 [Holothuria leucospilota]|uniref:Paraneoplastic antigen-like protein 5 n=1 Tax=Holothuria leucospilota TaxID=206669 RepID=A0A9Q1HGI1_HOLLE|nr:Paraneoplastic antigen-like protein 5 [Holothuria leucospilota]
MPPSTYVPPPKLSPFSGVPAQKAGEVSFEAWVYEVKSLQKSGYSKSILAPIVRRSLRGDAALLTMHLGLDVSIEGIISKLEGRYGTVESGACLLQQFYNSKQKEKEKVADFGSRLETAVHRAEKRGGISKGAIDEALRVVFWMGLRDEKTKVAIRHQKDHVKDFDELVKLARMAEQEEMEQPAQSQSQLQTRTVKSFQQRVKPTRSNNNSNTNTANSTDKHPSEVEELKKKVAELTQKLQEFTANPQAHRQGPIPTPRNVVGNSNLPRQTFRVYREPIRCYRCLEEGHFARDCTNEVVCLKCGMKGHIAAGCRQNSTSNNLNEGGSLPDGGR